MKKLFITLLAFVLTITSCSSDDDNDINEELIENASDSISEINEDISEDIIGTNDINEDAIEANKLISSQITNLEADVESEERDPVTGQATVTGEFTKFDFETGQITDSETDWDIAFRTTAIIINGGESTSTIDEPERNQEVEVAIVTGTLDSVTTAEDLEFNQDSANGYAIIQQSDMGWYNYNFATNILSPIPGKVLVFKTRNGNYAKVEVLSYYLDQDETSDPRYYTFNYTYNTTIGNTSFE